MVKGVEDFITFLAKAFGAESIEMIRDPEGRVMHAEVKIGDSIMMLGEPNKDWPAAASGYYLYVEDCDAWFDKAIAAGATVIAPVADQFYGDRSGGVQDAWGNKWWLATRKETLSEEELNRRGQEWSEKQAAK
jgi:PhnB protein